VRAAQRRASRCFVGSVDTLSLLPTGAVSIQAIRVGETSSLEGLVASLREAQPEGVCVDELDAVLVRTNPGRDDRAWAHSTAMTLLRVARDRGVLVLSDPDGLARASSKLYLAELPANITPRTLVTRDRAHIDAFLHDVGGPCVLKPLSGTHGRDVFRVDAAQPANLNQIVDVLARQGYVMAQEFVPEAVEGDVRLLMLHGEVLTVGGCVAAVRRVPSGADFRSNISAGGRAVAADLTPELLAVAQAVGPLLVRDGIFLAGLDVIGTKVVEVNVFSPGGFQDAEAFTGIDFSQHVISEVARRLARRD
jgi:glutathione synthase